MESGLRCSKPVMREEYQGSGSVWRRKPITSQLSEYTKSIKGGPKDETYLSKPYFCKLFYLLIVHQTITLSPSCSNHLSKYHPLATRTLTHEHLGILYIQTTTDGSVFELNILRNVN